MERIERQDRRAEAFAADLAGVLERGWPARVHLGDDRPGRTAAAAGFSTECQHHLELQLSGRQCHGISVAGVWREVSLAAGDLIYWPPGAWWQRHPPQGGRILGVNFRDDTLRVVSGRMGRRLITVSSHHCADPIGRAGRGVLEALAALTRTADAVEDGVAARPLLIGLLTLVERHLRTDRPVPRSQQARHTWIKVRHYVAEHYAEEIARDAVAAAVGVHPNYLSTLCRTVDGRSLQQLIVDTRMEQAEALLRRTDLSAAAIGRACGYSNASHFSAVFRRRNGLSPGRWRAARRGEAD